MHLALKMVCFLMFLFFLFLLAAKKISPYMHVKYENFGIF